MTLPTASPVPDVPMPYRLRLVYAWRCLVGRVRIVGDVDATHLPVDGYLEGTIRVHYSKTARLRVIAAGLRRAGDGHR